MVLIYKDLLKTIKNAENTEGVLLCIWRWFSKLILIFFEKN